MGENRWILYRSNGRRGQLRFLCSTISVQQVRTGKRCLLILGFAGLDIRPGDRLDVFKEERKDFRNSMKDVEIFTDGACSGNPGPGGYGVILRYQGRERELSGGEKSTTNNRMELTALIQGLQALKEPCRVTLYSDSKYVVDAIQKGWAKKWRANGWMRTKTERALNVDLWEKALQLLERHEMRFVWVKGHAGHPENERCDRLAVLEAAKYK